MRLGKQVEKRILEYGYKKCYVAKWLKMSRPTLNRRLKDDQFSQEQIAILRNKELI